MLRIQSSLLSLFVRRLPCFQNRIYASNTAASRSSNDDDWEDEKKTKTDAQREHEDGEEEAASIASMIGPYMSSKQIAFHTGQFDSEKIQKKNKQAFLVRVFFSLETIDFMRRKIFYFRFNRMLSKLIKFNFRIVVVTSSLFELPYDV